MKIIVISDTHGQHEQLGVLAGDVLIHCGDFCFGTRRAGDDLASLDEWFGRQSFRHILCTAGNHDFAVEEKRARGEAVFRNARYLHDEGFEYGGRKFWGAPWTPELIGWAHYRDEMSIGQHWNLIPRQTDVLITHTPPFGIRDTNSRGKQCGCASLLTHIQRVRPRVHCFGHVHAAAGRHFQAQTEFINASVVGTDYQLARPPVVLEL